MGPFHSYFSLMIQMRWEFDSALNSLRPRPNRRHFADDIFKCIFENENELITPRMSLKFVPKVRINNIPALVQIMAWRRPGDKPLSEPMMVSLPTHICVTRPQWVNRQQAIIWTNVGPVHWCIYICGTRGRWVNLIWQSHTLLYH